MMKKDKYNTERSSREQKIACNKLFANVAAHYKGDTLILDSELAFTGKYLINRRFPKTKIWIPNPFVSEQIKEKLPHSKIFNQYVNELLHTHTNRVTFNNVWLDYMCSMDGNKNIKPIEDIKYYFRNKMHNHGAFAVTLSYRKITGTTRKYEDLSRICALISREAIDNGYLPKLKTQNIYRGMFFVLFDIHTNIGSFK